MPAKIVGSDLENIKMLDASLKMLDASPPSEDALQSNVVPADKLVPADSPENWSTLYTKWRYEKRKPVSPQKAAKQIRLIINSTPENQPISLSMQSSLALRTFVNDLPTSAALPRTPGANKLRAIKAILNGSSNSEAKLHAINMIIFETKVSDDEEGD